MLNHNNRVTWICDAFSDRSSLVAGWYTHHNLDKKQQMKRSGNHHNSLIDQTFPRKETSIILPLAGKEQQQPATPPQ